MIQWFISSCTCMTLLICISIFFGEGCVTKKTISQCSVVAIYTSSMIIWVTSPVSAKKNPCLVCRSEPFFFYLPAELYLWYFGWLSCCYNLRSGNSDDSQSEEGREKISDNNVNGRSDIIKHTIQQFHSAKSDVTGYSFAMLTDEIFFVIWAFLWLYHK